MARSSADAPTLREAPLGSRPTALVLSPGGALGAWQGGVVYALERHGLGFHSVLGASAGALNGVSYFQGETARLREIWRGMRRREFMRLAPSLTPPSLFCPAALRGYLARLVDEERCRALRRCWFYPLSVDVANGRLCQAEYSPEPAGPWEGRLVDHVLGSIAVPFVFPPARLPAAGGKPARILVDGAVMSFADLRPLALRGVRDFLFVTVLDRPGRRRPRFTVRGMISTLIHQMMIGLVDHSLAAVRDLVGSLGLRAFELGPSRPLDIRVFTFDAEECRRGFDLGVADAGAALRDPQAIRLV